VLTHGIDYLLSSATKQKTGSARFGAGCCGGFTTVGYTHGYSNPALSGLSEFANDFSTLHSHNYLFSKSIDVCISNA